MAVVSQSSTIGNGGTDEAEMSQNTVPLSRYFLWQDALLTRNFRDMRPAQQVAALTLLCDQQVKLNISWKDRSKSNDVVIADIYMPKGLKHSNECSVLIAGLPQALPVLNITSIEVVTG